MSPPSLPPAITWSRVLWQPVYISCRHSVFKWSTFARSERNLAGKVASCGCSLLEDSLSCLGTGRKSSLLISACLDLCIWNLSRHEAWNPLPVPAESSRETGIWGSACLDFGSQALGRPGDWAPFLFIPLKSFLQRWGKKDSKLLCPLNLCSQNSSLHRAPNPSPCLHGEPHRGREKGF